MGQRAGRIEHGAWRTERGVKGNKARDISEIGIRNEEVGRFRLENLELGVSCPVSRAGLRARLIWVSVVINPTVLLNGHRALPSAIWYTSFMVVVKKLATRRDRPWTIDSMKS